MEKVKEEIDPLEESKKLLALEPVTKTVVDIKEYQVSITEPVTMSVLESVTTTVVDVKEYIYHVSVSGYCLKSCQKGSSRHLRRGKDVRTIISTFSVLSEFFKYSVSVRNGPFSGKNFMRSSERF